LFDRQAHYSRGWGTRRGALLGGDKIGWYRGQPPWKEVLIVSSRVRPISPSHWEVRGTRRAPSWVEYRSGGTGAPHPGMDIFPALSPRAKPYCGVKCSQGLHFPVTIVYLKAG